MMCGSEVPWLRIQPVRSSSWFLGRRRRRRSVEHKERFKAEDTTSLDHERSPKHWSWFCFCTTTQSWTIQRSFQCVPLTLAVLYSHKSVFFTAVFWPQCEALSTELKSTLNADWSAVSECTAELPVPLDFLFKANYFWPFAANTMELTYRSFFLLGCILLDWALVASAEEGKCGSSPSNIQCPDLLSVVNPN